MRRDGDHFHKRGGTPAYRFNEVIKDADQVYVWDFWWMEAYLDGRGHMVKLPGECELEYALS
jgi:hypothetical protein